MWIHEYLTKFEQMTLQQISVFGSALVYFNVTHQITGKNIHILRD